MDLHTGALPPSSLDDLPAYDWADTPPLEGAVENLGAGAPDADLYRDLLDVLRLPDACVCPCCNGSAMIYPTGHVLEMTDEPVFGVRCDVLLLRSHLPCRAIFPVDQCAIDMLSVQDVLRSTQVVVFDGVHYLIASRHLAAFANTPSSLLTHSERHYLERAAGRLDQDGFPRVPALQATSRAPIVTTDTWLRGQTGGSLGQLLAEAGATPGGHVQVAFPTDHGAACLSGACLAETLAMHLGYLSRSEFTCTAPAFDWTEILGSGPLDPAPHEPNAPHAQIAVLTQRFLRAVRDDCVVLSGDSVHECTVEWTGTREEIERYITDCARCDRQALVSIGGYCPRCLGARHYAGLVGDAISSRRPRTGRRISHAAGHESSLSVLSPRQWVKARTRVNPFPPGAPAGMRYVSQAPWASCLARA